MPDMTFWKITAEELLEGEVVVVSNISKEDFFGGVDWVQSEYPNLVIETKKRSVEYSYFLWCKNRCSQETLNEFMTPYL